MEHTCFVSSMFVHNDSNHQVSTLQLGFTFRNNPNGRNQPKHQRENRGGWELNLQLWVKIWYIVINHEFKICYWLYQSYCRIACAINLGSTVVITGGHGPSEKGVTQYSESGFLRDLPHLQQGRWKHGCSFYKDNEGTKVCINSINGVTMELRRPH